MVYEMDRPNDEVEFPGMNVGYVRVSSAVEVDITAAIAAQKIGIQRFVEDRGGLVVDWYVDEDITGDGLDGPALQRMLTDVESGRRVFPRVFVWSVDRLNRNPHDFMTVLARLEAVGVVLIPVH